jgi:tetratricopeptide (TPR) repeat protein
VADLVRNARPIWIGTGGRFAPEWVADLKRNRWPVWSGISSTHHMLGQYQRAIEDYNESFRLKPPDAPGYNNRGMAYAYLGRYKKAQADYDEAIKLKPHDDSAYYNYACSFSLEKDALQACSWLERAIERGYKDWKHLEADKDFDNIRNEKCFIDIMNKYKK